MSSEFGIPDSEFEATLEYLFTRLPMFSRIGAAALKPDLTNTIALCAALGNPQQRFKAIHIAGTNGKGSTSHMLASIMQQAGYKTGLYTSPHLVDFRERIRIDGKMVSKDFVVDFVAKHKETIEAIQPSFFEITVAMAFEAFAEAQVDVAIIETGLGGRLDSTNIITPELSIITNIGLDHTDLLGKTIPEIAREKAGIIKPGIPVVIGQYNEESLEVFKEVAEARNAPLHLAWQGFGQIIATDQAKGFREAHRIRRSIDHSEFSLQTDLSGSFQRFNIRTVYAAVCVLRDGGWPLTDEIFRKGLFEVKARTGLRGRWDILQRRPPIVADVAHNPDGLSVILRYWELVQARQKHIIVGFVRDKDICSALSLFPKDNFYHFCAANLPRALPAAELAALAAEIGLQGEVHNSVEEAVIEAKKHLRDDVPLLITGSFFIVGEAMQALGILPE